jgi:5-formyltetrahydrofolate cyclo-ligase
MSLSAELARNQVRARLKPLSPAEVLHRSQTACSSWISRCNFLDKLKVVALYRALPQELELSALEIFLKQNSIRICYPRIIPSSSSTLGDLELLEVPDPHEIKHWSNGAYGIDEPHHELARVAPEEVDLVWVPALAIGEQGERVGRGKGYYDRLLARMPQSLRISFVFDFQVFPQLEQKAWDQPVHWIMTDQREIRLATAETWLGAFK